MFQATEMLGLYQAELARILGMQCSDIGRLSGGKQLPGEATEFWKQAVLFVRLHELLYDKFNGDEVAVYHWLRAENPALQGVPLYLFGRP